MIFEIYLGISILTFVACNIISMDVAKSIDSRAKFYFGFSNFKLLLVSFVPIVNIVLLLILLFKSDSIFESVSEHVKKHIKD